MCGAFCYGILWTERNNHKGEFLWILTLPALPSGSAKAISKWETAHGLPDISLLEPLAAALGVSVLELMQGEPVVNRNRSANLLRSKLYVCPLCGNVLHATGQAVVSCCGITLPPLDTPQAHSCRL